jgi:alpha-tubulin suppressor-like RCC1 family protein
MRRILALSLLVALASCGDSGDTNTGPPSEVASVIVSPAQFTLLIGGTQQLTATARDHTGNPVVGNPVTWASSDESVATVSQTGVVTALAVGSTSISATAAGKTGTATATVSGASQEPVATVSVSPGPLTLAKGGAQLFEAILEDQAGNLLFGRAVSWASSDPSVATVSLTGVVTGVAPGTATITATAEEKSGTSQVSVSIVAFSAIAAGGDHTCALTADGAAWCWGRAESGQLGVSGLAGSCVIEGQPVPCSLSPVQVQGGLSFDRLAGGGAHTCGLTRDGVAFCWGDNSRGQLGDNTIESRDVPVPVATDVRFARIDAGAQHTCGLTAAGTAYCWGRNDRGQLGDGTTAERHQPVRVTGNRSFRLIVAGGVEIGHTCAIGTDGVDYCWGDNERGQLGNGNGGLGREDTDPHPEPAAVLGTVLFDSLSAGLGRHTCGLTHSGIAYCWGENTAGALGDGSTVDRLVPVAVSGGFSFRWISAGGASGHTCGIIAGSAAYCWGDNGQGQIGDNTTTDRLQPTPVSGALAFSFVDAGYRHTCGLATNRILYCWGSNSSGQLGINATGDRLSPTEVAGQR